MTISEILNIITNGKSIKSWFSSFNDSNQLVKLDDSGKLPAVDGSLLTGLPTEIIWLTDESFRPTVGVTDKAYVSKATGIIYRYDTVSGSYKVIGGGEGTPYMTATGTNTYIVTNTPAVTAYPKAVYMAFQNANTGAATITIDALTALPIKSDGNSLGKNIIKAGAVKLLLLSSDSTYYHMQQGYENPAVSSGQEKVLVQRDDGTYASYDVVDKNSTTSESALIAATWTDGTATGVAGVEGTWVLGTTSNYLYLCTGTNTWIRIPCYVEYLDPFLTSIDDSAGVKTSAQMATIYPSATYYQKVIGTAGVYEFFGLIGWKYTAWTS